jgi:hypothetical protein
MRSVGTVVEQLGRRHYRGKALESIAASMQTQLKMLVEGIKK